ncbi:MAG: hypothetical protein ACW99Q_26820 [Candidatus Kariarchaeaceae archaeon]
MKPEREADEGFSEIQENNFDDENDKFEVNQRSDERRKFTAIEHDELTHSEILRFEDKSECGSIYLKSRSGGGKLRKNISEIARVDSNKPKKIDGFDKIGVEMKFDEERISAKKHDSDSLHVDLMGKFDPYFGLKDLGNISKTF